MDRRNNFPKLHNAMWPGLVGKGPDSEPPISLDEMLQLTAAAEVDSIKFDGVDLFPAEPHTSINSSSDDIKKLADTSRQKIWKSALWSLRYGRRWAAAPPWATRLTASGSSRWSAKPAASASNCASSASQRRRGAN